MKPRKINLRDPSTWPVSTVIEAGRRGTKAEVEEFGHLLLKVRYRKAGRRTVKTVELMVMPPSQTRKEAVR